MPYRSQPRSDSKKEFKEGIHDRFKEGVVDTITDSKREFSSFEPFLFHHNPKGIAKDMANLKNINSPVLFGRCVSVSIECISVCSLSVDTSSPFVARFCDQITSSNAKEYGIHNRLAGSIHCRHSL